MAKSQKQGRSGAAGSVSSTSGSDVTTKVEKIDASTAAKDAEALLRADHRKVEQLFRQFEKDGDGNGSTQGEGREDKKDLARQICNELIIHAMLEEEIFYPACRASDVEMDLLDEAQVEHDTLKLLIGDVLRQEPASPYYDAKFTVLSEYVKHHVTEEEKPSSGIFAKARKAGVDMDELGRRLQERKQALTTQAESGALRPGAPRAIETSQGVRTSNRQESEMARQFDRYRDDRGRDMDEYGRRSSGGRSSRDRQDEEESGGRFSGRSSYSDRGMGGTREGTGYSQGRGRDDEFAGGDRGYTGGGSGYTGGDDYARGERGGYQDERSRGGGYGSGYGRGGTPGGGFSRGNYGGGGYSGGGYSGGRNTDEDYYGQGRGGSRERDEQGRFVSDDDNGGSGRGGRGQGRGWFGDPEGHSRAAQRRGSLSGRYEDDDENNGGRGGRGGFDRERDEQGRFMSSDDDDRGGRSGGGGRGQGGWFGDSRGHSEASRRGWRNRD
jgi:hemerythrin superfamily protein